MSNLQNGIVISTHGRHCIIHDNNGNKILCHPRGKKLQAIVGDYVKWQISHDEGVIEKILPRKNHLYRQDEMRSKSFAANIDLALILLGAIPTFSNIQLSRALIACEAAQINPIIVLNKSDLTHDFNIAWQRLKVYENMGYKIYSISAENTQSLSEIKQILENKTTLIFGPSGAGKSTLINQIIPDAKAATAEISQALNTGKHTTTSTTLYWLNNNTAIIDSPGFQAFGLNHIKCTELSSFMPDIKAYSQDCRFYNCTHLHEPACGVIAQIGNNIDQQRHEIYKNIFNELKKSENTY